MGILKGIVVCLLTLCLSLFSNAQQLPDTILREIKDFTELEKIQYLGELCWDLNEKSNEEAIQYGKYALHLADSLHFYDEVAKISNYLGVAMLYYQYSTRQAWDYFRQSLEYGIKSNDSVVTAYAYDNIGYMYYLHGNLPAATDYVQNAYQIFTELNNERGLAYINTSIGLIQAGNKKYKNALKYYEIALEKHQKTNNLDGQAAVYSCIGKAYLGLKNYQKAREIFEKQIEISEKAENSNYLADGLKGIGDVLYFNENYSEAFDYIIRAAKINEEKQDFYGLVENKIRRALILGKTGRLKEGEEQILQAFDVAKQLGVAAKVFDIYKAYSEFSHFPGYAGNTSKIYEDLFNIYDSLYVEYEKEKLLNEEQRVEIARNLEQVKTELGFQRSRLFLYYALVFLLLVVGFVLFWKYNTRRRLSNKLRRANDKLKKEMDEKNKVLEALRKSETELKASNQNKSRFFSIIAHDLRSPFNSILGFVNILKNEYHSLDEETREEYIGHLNDSTRRVYNLLENLLFWAGTQTQKIKFSPETIDVEKIVQETLLLFDDAREQKGIHLILNIKPEISLWADLNMFKIILRNLISNAIKYTHPDGQIVLNIETTEKNAEKVFLFSISDDGMGMSEEQKNHLFTPEPIKSSLGTDNEKGTGLGLMLCAELIKIHNGEIWVESELNKGSRFSFTIPFEV